MAAHLTNHRTTHPERHTVTDSTTDQTTERADLAAFLAGHLGGRTSELLSAEFHELLDAVKVHGKKGQLVITLVVDPPANGVDSAPLPIGVESALKAPKPSATKSLYFLDNDGNPVRDDPRQTAPGIFRAVDGTTEFRLADTTTDFKDAR